MSRQSSFKPLFGPGDRVRTIGMDETSQKAWIHCTVLEVKTEVVVMYILAVDGARPGNYEHPIYRSEDRVEALSGDLRPVESAS